MNREKDHIQFNEMQANRPQKQQDPLKYCEHDTREREREDIEYTNTYALALLVPFLRIVVRFERRTLRISVSQNLCGDERETFYGVERYNSEFWWSLLLDDSVTDYILISISDIWSINGINRNRKWTFSFQAVTDAPNVLRNGAKTIIYYLWLFEFNSRWLSNRLTTTTNISCAYTMWDDCCCGCYRLFASRSRTWRHEEGQTDCNFFEEMMTKGQTVVHLVYYSRLQQHDTRVCAVWWTILLEHFVCESECVGNWNTEIRLAKLSMILLLFRQTTTHERNCISRQCYFIQSNQFVWSDSSGGGPLYYASYDACIYALHVVVSFWVIRNVDAECRCYYYLVIYSNWIDCGKHLRNWCRIPTGAWEIFCDCRWCRLPPPQYNRLKPSQFNLEIKSN